MALSYKLSEDAKTVRIGGKTLSISAFKNQYNWDVMARPGEMGRAEPKKVPAKVVSTKVSDGPEAAKKRAEKKAQKAGLKMLNKAGLGQKLTEPKPAAGKTRIGGLGTGRGAISGLGGGGLMDVNK